MHSPIAARVHACFVAAAREVTLLVDSTKFDAPTLFTAAPASSLHRIVTDKGMRPQMGAAFEARGVEMIIADEKSASER
jgi:DeoR family glucitol operon repressor